MELMARRFSEEHGIDIQADGSEACLAITFSGLPGVDGTPNEAGIGAVAHDDDVIPMHLLAAAVAMQESIDREVGDLLVALLTRLGEQGAALKVSAEAGEKLMRAALQADRDPDNEPEPEQKKDEPDEPDVKW